MNSLFYKLGQVSALEKLGAMTPQQIAKFRQLLTQKPGVRDWLKQQFAQGGVRPFPGAKPIPIG